MTCSSEMFDPSAESDFLERNLQHHIHFQKLADKKKVVRLTSGEYAACGFEVSLKRKHEPLVYQVYIPCILFVTVSWISFIIDPKVCMQLFDLSPNVIVRLYRDECLSWWYCFSSSSTFLTTLSTCFAFIISIIYIYILDVIRASAPAAASSRLNAIDRFIVTCIFSIFSAIVEYAIVLSILTLRFVRILHQRNICSHYLLDFVEFLNGSFIWTQF